MIVHLLIFHWNFLKMENDGRYFFYYIIRLFLSVFRDSNRRLHTDPSMQFLQRNVSLSLYSNHLDYDPRTLYVPEEYLNSITPVNIDQYNYSKEAHTYFYLQGYATMVDIKNGLFRYNSFLQSKILYFEYLLFIVLFYRLANSTNFVCKKRQNLMKSIS